MRSTYELEPLDPVFVMQKAFSRVMAVGSSTALVAILNRDNKLVVSNLGDSGYLHFRQGEGRTDLVDGQPQQKMGDTITFGRSKAQTHNFNIPY